MNKREKEWTREEILTEVKKVGPITYMDLIARGRHDLAMAAFRLFGGWRRAVEAAGFEYPGNYRWRTNFYRGNFSVFLEEIEKVPAIKAGAVALAKEHGLPLKRRKKIKCIRCGKAIFTPRRYCKECRKISDREKTKARVRRFYQRFYIKHKKTRQKSGS